MFANAPLIARTAEDGWTSWTPSTHTPVHREVVPLGLKLDMALPELAARDLKRAFFPSCMSCSTSGYTRPRLKERLDLGP